MIKAFIHAVWALAVLAAEPAYAQLAGSKTVAIESRNARGEPVQLSAHVFEPAQAARTAVILLHSSVGMTEAVQGHYGKELSAAGHLVVAVDSFKGRGILRTVDDQSQAGSIHMALDGLYARQYVLRNYPGIVRSVVMGFSKGGLAAMMAADRTFHAAMAERFDAHIALYPSCAFMARHPKPVGPLLMLLGEKDGYSGVEPCQQWGAAFARAGAQVKTIIYPDAQHLFDGDPQVSSVTYLSRAENFSKCLVYLEDNGQWSYRDKLYPDQLATYGDLSRSCVTRGASFATNLRAKEAALRDIKSYLTELGTR